MNDWNARQLAYVMMNMAEVQAQVADIEALKAELVSMQANDRGRPDGGGCYSEGAYLEIATKINERAQTIRVIAGQMGQTALNIQG